MPARTPLVLALIATLSLPLAASAQSSFLAARGMVVASPEPTSVTPYAGTYTANGGSVELVERPGALQVVVTGAPVAAALAGLSPRSGVLDTRAHTLLAAWVAGDTSPLTDAVVPSRQLVADAHFAAFRSALTRRIGDMTSAEIIGTFRQTNGRPATLARVHFEHGAQWISLVWTNGGDLATIKRGLSPVLVGIARPTGRDTFGIAGTPITFTRDTTGRIHELAIGTQLQATR